MFSKQSGYLNIIRKAKDTIQFDLCDYKPGQYFYMEIDSEKWNHIVMSIYLKNLY